MLHPTIKELTKDEFNRYELTLATAKCARELTDEYVKQREEAEKAIAGNKDSDRTIAASIDRDLKDEKAIKNAITRFYDGRYEIYREESTEQTAKETSEK
ncbi:MAG: DNA-directed RNA polymerase subunit omega [Eubacteriales bacterium]